MYIPYIQSWYIWYLIFVLQTFAITVYNTIGSHMLYTYKYCIVFLTTEKKMKKGTIFLFVLCQYNVCFDVHKSF